MVRHNYQPVTHFKSIQSKTQLYHSNNEINHQQLLNISHREFSHYQNLRGLDTMKKKVLKSQQTKVRNSL